MIRGCQRRIYHVKNPGGEIFDEAYFVLRRGYMSRGIGYASDGELAREALRIAEQTCPGKSGRSVRKENVVSFAVGAAAAGAAAGAAFLLFLR